MKFGRLIPLSKRKDNITPNNLDVRPIIIKSHLTKIFEKAILAKVKSIKSNILLTKDTSQYSNFTPVQL